MKRYIALLTTIMLILLCTSCSDDFPSQGNGESAEGNNIITETQEDTETESKTDADSTDSESDSETEGESISDNEIDNETDSDSATESEIESDSAETESVTASPHVDFDENDYCDKCGEKIDTDTENDGADNVETPVASSALFDKFYDSSFDLTATNHSNGGKMTEKSDTYTNAGYELKFTNYTNVYKNARDAKGNPALKLGKTTEKGSFEVKIPDDITKVVLKIAKYKDHDSAVIINGKEYTLAKNSNDGEYDEIIVDTSETKMIIVSTTEACKICMIRSIEFIK